MVGLRTSLKVINTSSSVVTVISAMENIISQQPLDAEVLDLNSGIYESDIKQIIKLNVL